MIRLNKYLASVGVASRRASDYLISEGHVLVNGQVATVGMKLKNFYTEKTQLRFLNILEKVTHITKQKQLM